MDALIEVPTNLITSHDHGMWACLNNQEPPKRQLHGKKPIAIYCCDLPFTFTLGVPEFSKPCKLKQSSGDLRQDIPVNLAVGFSSSTLRPPCVVEARSLGETSPGSPAAGGLCGTAGVGGRWSSHHGRPENDERAPFISQFSDFFAETITSKTRRNTVLFPMGRA